MPLKTYPRYSEPEKAQTILRMAALFKTGFSIDWIIQLMGDKPSAVIEVLETAVKNGLLTKLDYSRFRFSDPGKQEELQKGINPEQKNLLQRKIANLLLKELPDNEEKAEQVAGNLLDTRNDLEQCRWLAKAGDIYVKSFKAKEALQCYLKVLDDLSHLKAPPVDALFIETVIKYSRIADFQFNIHRILTLLNSALDRAEQKQDLRSAALLQMHIAKNEWYRSNYPESLRRFQKGWAISQETDDVKLRYSAITFSAFFHYWQGYFAEGVNIYESQISDMEEVSQGTFQLMAESLVGNCYVMIGQAANGFGMIHAVRSRCIKIGDRFMEAFNGLVMAISLINIQRFEEAMEHIRVADREARKWPRSPLSMICYLLTAYVYYHSENSGKAIQYLKKFLRLREQIEVSMWPYPYLLELCWAAESNRIPSIAGLVFEDEINHAKKSKNVFMIGIAHRFQAILQQQKGSPKGAVYRSLKASEKWLSKSGHMMELFRTRLSLYNQYLLDGKEKKASEVIRSVSTQLSRMPISMVPPDLRSLRKEGPDAEDLVNDFSNLGEKVMEIGEQGALMHHLITTANRMVGAERGAVFLVENQKHEIEFSLYAARNLTNEQIADPGFDFAWKAIREVVETGRGIKRSQTRLSLPAIEDHIRSLVCMPLKFRNKLIGVLYHDNRMLLHAFQDSHLSQLYYFAAIISLVIKNQMIHQELTSIVKGSLDHPSVTPAKEFQHGIIGQSRAILRVLSQIEQVAATDTTVLILGETGVGKELVARAIHENGSRRNNPFVSVNCNALPDSLISTELFGHEKGAFTGALQRRIGRFELASRGTLFLDEIGELPLETQVKLLRVLQSREFERIGGSQTLRSDFRLVTSTNRDLESEVETGRFRSDLFYRLNIFPIIVPPLRERKEDIPILARHFLQMVSLKIGKRFQSFPEKEMEKLMRYDWPGNVRELENVIERGTVLSQSAIFRIPDLTAKPEPSSFSSIIPEMSLIEVERHHILQTLRKSFWKIRGPGGAAELLDIHPSTLYSRMKKLGIRKTKTRE